MISVCHPNLFIVLLVCIAAFGDQRSTISIIDNKEFQGLGNMSMERLVACDFEVFGRVQGVFFRKFTASQANTLGVKGWVMNTASGSVKGQLEGSEDKVNAIRLPLPIEIQNIAVKTVHDEPGNDPAKHEGRVRSFQHERGNWPTFAYIEVQISSIETLQEEIADLTHWWMELKPISELHISLTKTVVLQHHWIDSFTDSVRNETASIKQFVISFQDIKTYCNEERTRTFIGLRTSSQTSEFLSKISNRMDTILREFRLPEFYREPSFHCSILWCLGDKEALLNNKLEEMQNIFRTYSAKCGNDLQININTIYCKTGNKLFRFEL